MKLRPISSIFAISIFMLGAATGSGQDGANPLEPEKAPTRIYIGPVGGYNRSMHTGEFQSIPPELNNDNLVPCPVFNGGTNNGFYVGGTMEYILGNPKDAVSSIVGKIVFNSLPASFDVPGIPYPVVNEETGEPVSTTVQHVSEVRYQTIDADFLYKLNLFDSKFGVIAGPTIGFALGAAQQEQRFELLEPTSATFKPLNNPDLKYSNNNRTITVRDGDLPNASGFRLGIKAGVQYEQPLFRNKFFLVPHIFYNFGVTKLTSAESWRVNAIQTGVDLRFAL